MQLRLSAAELLKGEDNWEKWLTFLFHFEWLIIICAVSSTHRSDTTAQTRHLNIRFFIRMSPSTNLTLQMAPAQTAPLALSRPRLPRLDVSSAWDVVCLLTRLPHLHPDFVITSVHYQFVFWRNPLLPSRMSLHALYLLTRRSWSILLIKGASGDNLMDSMLPTGSVKGQIYGALLLSEALVTGIVLLRDSTGTRLRDNSGNLTRFRRW